MDAYARNVLIEAIENSWIMRLCSGHPLVWDGNADNVLPTYPEILGIAKKSNLELAGEIHKALFPVIKILPREERYVRHAELLTKVLRHSQIDIIERVLEEYR